MNPLFNSDGSLKHCKLTAYEVRCITNASGLLRTVARLADLKPSVSEALDKIIGCIDDKNVLTLPTVQAKQPEQEQPAQASVHSTTEAPAKVTTQNEPADTLPKETAEEESSEPTEPVVSETDAALDEDIPEVEETVAEVEENEASMFEKPESEGMTPEQLEAAMAGEGDSEETGDEPSF